jgi:hypothetical protein
MATTRMALKKTKEETLGIDKIYLKKGHLTGKSVWSPYFILF